MAFDFAEVLRRMVESRASDVHLTPGVPPAMRDKGKIVPMEGFDVLTGQETREVVYSILNDDQRKRFENDKQLDFAYAIPGVARFRVNCFFQRGSVSAAFRLVPQDIPALDSLGVPQVLRELCAKPRGFVLVTGPTGSGKSTTLAAMIDVINCENQDHILTIEDPIEFLHQHKRSIVNQREVGSDAPDFALGLRAALREDPDVILVGEMRDLETISTALTAAETGHLVFATLHTQSTAQTVDRIIDVFPPQQQGQVRTQLSIALQGIVTQQLLPTADGMGRVVATEVLVPTPAIRNLIREGKTHQIYAAVQTSGAVGMQTMDADLARLVRAGKITRSLAEQRASVPEELKRLLGRRRCRPPRCRRDGSRQRLRLPPPTSGGLADGGREHLRLPRDGRRRGRDAPAKLEADSKAQVTEQLRQRGLIVLDVSEKKRAVQDRGPLQTLEGRRHARAGGLLAPVRDPGRLGDADAAHPAHAGGADPGRADQGGDRRGAGRRRGRQHAGAGDGAPPRSLRPPLPGDGPLRRGVGPARGRARPGRLPGGESRRPAPPGQIGDDVPGCWSSASRSWCWSPSSPSSSRSSPASSKNSPKKTPAKSSALPLPTQICVTASDAITGYWFIIIPALIGLAVGFFRWKKTDRGKEMWDRFKLRLPFQIGDVIQKVALARWSRTFSGSVSAGVPMLQSIKLTGETAGNVVLEQAMEDVYASAKRGGSLAGPIERNPIFPPMVGHMVAVGEETGQLEHMLSKIADFYETEVDAKVKALTSLIEPLMIVFVGGVVGFIVISMYLPIFSLYDKIR